MTTENEIICNARKWLGAKWQHQACLPYSRCDCIGLIRGVSADLGMIIDQEDLNYSRQPYRNEEKLRDKCAKYLKEISLSEIKPGDILLFGTDKMPAYHVGILSYDGFIIHTWLDIGKVVESRFDEHWRGNLRFAFRFKGVE